MWPTRLAPISALSAAPARRACTSGFGLRGGARLRLPEQHILRGTAHVQHQLHGTVEAIEQRRRQAGIAVGPTQTIVRFEGVESIFQQRVRRFHHAKPRPLAQRDPLQCHAEDSRVARQAKFRRGAGARDNSDRDRARRDWPRRQAEDVRSKPRRGRQPVAVHQQVQVWIFGQRQARARARALQQAAPDRIHLPAPGQHRRTRFLRRQIPAAVRVPEQPSVAIIAIALRGRAIGQQHVVAGEFQVIERDLLRQVVP